MNLRQSIIQSLPRLGNGRLAVLGDFCLDAYWHADMRRSQLSRETPHYPLPIVHERYSAGGAGNVVANLCALEPAAVHCIGVFGDDWRGKIYGEILKDVGAEISGILIDSSRVTNTYIKPLRRGISDIIYEDPRMDFTNDAPLAVATEDRLLEHLDQLAPSIDVLCICDQMIYGCVTPRVRQRVMEWAQKGLTVIVDSRDRIGEYRDVIVKPNEIEAGRAFGETAIPPERLGDCALRLSARTGRPALVTAGENGCFLAENGKATHVPAFHVEGEIDFCGAGDSFQAGLACAMAAGLPLAEAAIIANACAAVTIRKLHTTGTASRKELEAQLLEN